jgi:hypothetical protein
VADAATLVYDIDSSQAVGAAKALALMGQAAGKAAADSAKLERSFRGADGRFIKMADAAKQNESAIKSLASEFNPLLAAQMRFADAEARVADAVRLGVVSKDQAATLLPQLAAQYQAAAAAQARFGQSAEVATHHATNLSFQLNDIGMMMSLGQSPFSLMMQQGPQVAQIMSQITAEGGKIGPTLAGAFASIINPVTLVTLAVIGGTAALYQWATSADEADKKAGKFSDRLSDLKSQIELVGEDFTFNIQTNTLEANVDQIVTKYGSLNDAVRTHINLLNEAAAAAAGYASIDLMAAFSETFGNGWLTTQIDEVRIAFDTTNDEARRLIYMMDNIQKAEGISNQRDAAIALRDEIYRMTGGIENMTAKQVAFALQVNQTVDALTQAEVQLNRNTASAQDAALATAQWAANTGAVVGHLQNAANLLASIGGGAIQRASRAAQSAALAAGATTTQIAAAGARAESIGQLQKALQSKQITIEEYARLRTAVDEEAAAWSSLNTQIDARADAEREAAKKPKKGPDLAKRAAAELKQAQNKFQSLRELLEKETIFNFAEYEKRQTQLDLALQKKLITEQNYEAMRQQLRTYYFGSEFEQKQLQYQMDHDALVSALDRELITRQEYAARMREMQWGQVSALGEIRGQGYAYELNQMADAFGQMNQMAGGNYDKLLKAQRIFASASALISTMQGAAKALELPFPLNIAAAGKVIAAGMGFISAIKSGRSSGGGGGGGASTATPAPTQTPVQNVLVNLTGDQWLVDMAGEVIDQISEQSRNGRVIIQRDRGN